MHKVSFSFSFSSRLLLNEKALGLQSLHEASGVVPGPATGVMARTKLVVSQGFLVSLLCNCRDLSL